MQTGDLDKAWLMRKECRAKVNAEATPVTMQAAFRRLFPLPARSRYVALCLLPRQPLLARLVSSQSWFHITLIYIISVWCSPLRAFPCSISCSVLFCSAKGLWN